MSVRTTSELTHIFGSGATATVALIAAVPLMRITVHRMILTIGSPGVTVTIQDTTGAALSQPFAMAANAAMILDTPTNFDPWWQTLVGRGMQIGQSGTTAIGWDLYYLQGP